MRLFRLCTILAVTIGYGLDDFLFAHPHFSRARWSVHAGKYLFRALGSWRRLLPWSQQTAEVRLRRALERLGPIFVKFGQMLSTRRDLIPALLADELAKLQDRVPPFPGARAQHIVETALGRPIATLFADFSPQAVASASIAQVHRAMLPDGRPVAVKVLRPRLLPVIESDLALLALLAAWAERWLPDGKRLRPREVVAEFDQLLHDELDFLREAANASTLRRNFHERTQKARVCAASHTEAPGDTSETPLLVPEVIWSHTARTVLTLEWMEGIPISHTARLVAQGIDLPTLARAGVDIFYTQVFHDGFFHADMHPGNIQVAPDGRYIALDFGIMGSLDEFDKRYLAINFLAFFQRDYHRVATAHIESGWAPAGTRPEELEAAIRTVCEPIFGKPLAEISLGQILLRLFETSRRFQIPVQPQLVLLQKTLLNIEGLGRQLDPKLDLWATSKPFLERWMREQVGWRALWRNIRKEAPYWSETLPALPRALAQLGQLGDVLGLNDRVRGTRASGAGDIDQDGPSRARPDTLPELLRQHVVALQVRNRWLKIIALLLALLVMLFGWGLWMGR